MHRLRKISDIYVSIDFLLLFPIVQLVFYENLFFTEKIVIKVKCCFSQRLPILFHNKFDQSKVQFFDYNRVKFQVGKRKGLKDMEKLTMKHAARAKTVRQSAQCSEIENLWKN